MLKVDLNKQYLEEAEDKVRKQVISEHLEDSGSPVLRIAQLEENIGRHSCDKAFSMIKDIALRNLG